MKYRAVYERSNGTSCVFGMYARKADAIKSVSWRFRAHELVKDCVSVRIVRTSDWYAVWEYAL